MRDYQKVVAELTTIRDMLRWITSQFNAAELYFGHGTDNAWDEAVSLVLRSLHLSYTNNIQFLDAKLTETERTALLELVKKRIEDRIPVPYLINEAWFAGLPFYVDERVLIPRSPLAELIEQQFTPWVEPEAVAHILDLCTGSGCIAVACAMAFPEAIIDAVELDAGAMQVAAKNIRKHGLEQQVKLVSSDLFNNLPTKRYDIIVSNPPYVSDEEMASLPPEYCAEPILALRADEQGLAIVQRILRQAADYLTEQGVLIVEVGNSEQALIEYYPQIPFTWLEFELGGQGVFLLTAEQVKLYQNDF